MAKIDTSKIDGFDAMNAEEKLNALLGYEFAAPEEPEDVSRLKQALNKANGESANYKRQLRELQTEDARQKAEKEEADQKLQEELEELRQERTMRAHKDSFLKAGYSDELAAASAKALTEGDMDAVFANLGTFVANKTKEIEAASLNDQPGLTTGTPPTGGKADPYTSAFEKAALGG